MRDEQPNNEQLKIELLSQWKMEAESRNEEEGKMRTFVQNEEHFSTLVLVRTKSSIEDLSAATGLHWFTTRWR